MSLPKVFISATSADLGATRQVVKEALLSIGCHPVEQTNFGPDWRTVSQMLREKIGGCQALIHIAGLHYGAEPDPASLSDAAVCRSYTQMEFDIGRELQRQRGDRRFRVYTFVCPEDFPYQASLTGQSEEQRALQAKHRQRILDGAALYETPAVPDVLKARVLALREEALALRAVHDRRAQLTLIGMVVIALALAGVGYGVFRANHDLPAETAQQVARQFDPEAISSRLRSEIQTRFERDADAARAAGRTWEVVHELERKRDAALASIDNTLRTIKEGLAGEPTPIFVEATRILEREGAEAAIAYLESHKADQLARADRAAARAAEAQEALQRELQPLMLQADLHESRLEWEQALNLRQIIADKAPQWFEARLSLGNLLDELAHYGQAEDHKRAAVQLARTPVEKGSSIGDLSTLLFVTNQLSEAEALMRRALAIDEAGYGAEHAKVAIHLNNLAVLLKATNRLSEAEPLMRRALAIDEASFGAEHPEVATALNNLAQLLQATDRLSEAEPLMRRALAIDEASYGAEHPNVARDLNNLAALLQATNRLGEAEPLMRRALGGNEASYGADHPNVATNLNNLAQLLQDANLLGEAESLMRRALAIDEASYGAEHSMVARDLNNLADLLRVTNRLGEAEPLMRKAVGIYVQFGRQTGHQDPHESAAFKNYQQLLAAMGRNEAEQRAAIEAVIASANTSDEP